MISGKPLNKEQRTKNDELKIDR